MSNPRRGVMMAVPITIGLTATVFAVMLYFYTSATKSIRAVEALPAVARNLTTPERFTGNNPECVAILADRQTAPLLVAKYKATTDDQNLRLLCFALLCEMQDAAAVPMVVDLLKTKEPTNVAWAIWGCSTKRLGEKVATPILDSIKGSTDGTLVAHAVDCLEQTESASAIEVYQWILAQKFDQGLRLRAVRSMAKYDNPNTVLALEKLFGDSDPAIVKEAADQMSEFPASKQAVKDVLKRALGSESAALRQTAVKIMRSLDDLPGLESALGNDDLPVAVEAAVALAAFKKEEKLGSLQPGPLKGRMESLIGRLDDQAELDRLGKALEPFVVAGDRERYFKSYEKGNATERIVYARLVGVTAGLSAVRSDDTVRGEFDRIGFRFIEDLERASDVQRLAYGDALRDIFQRSIQPEYEAWSKFREIRELLGQAKEKMKDPSGGLVTTFGKALRDEIYALLDRANADVEWLVSSGKASSKFEGEKEEIENLRNHVLHHGGIND